MRRRQVQRAVPWVTLALGGTILLAHAVASLGEGGLMPSYLDAHLDARLALIRNGARSTALIADAGEVWRVFTSALAHTGWTHLLFNLAFLLPALALLERRVGSGRALAGTVIIGCASSLLSLAWIPEVSAGASGLVFGWVGALAVYALRHDARETPGVHRLVGLTLLPFLALSLLLSAGDPSLDHASHLGGLLAGFAIGALLPRRRGVDPTSPRTAAPGPRTQGALGWQLAAMSSVVATLALARPVALSGIPSATVQVAPRVALDLPPTYRATTDDLGRIIYQGHSSLVRLTLDALPAATTALATPRRDALPPARRVFEQRVLPQVEAAILTPRSRPRAAASPEGPCTRQAFSRGGHPVLLSVCVVQVDEVDVVVTLETPAEWRDRYVPLLQHVLSSIRPISGAGPLRRPAHTSPPRTRPLD